MTNLEKALAEIAANKISPENLENVFDKISIELLRHTKLVAGKSKYLIREIEFYFSSEGHYSHVDPYSHSNQYTSGRRQEEFGEWYFHRYKSAENYEKQKFRGLDISFGNSENKNFGGILIRQIQNIDSKHPIQGISNIVGEIMNRIKVTELHNFATTAGTHVFDVNNSLHLENCEETNNKSIYKTIRVIPKPDTSEKEKFSSKLYRYFNHPEIKQVWP